MDSAPPCTAGDLSIYCSPESFQPSPDRLYRNDGGRFVEVSSVAGIRPDGRGMGVAVGDLDLDGDADLYVTNDRSQNHLYVNEGGRFREAAAESGVGYGPTGQIEGGMGSVVADLTGSGLPSIFQTNFQKEPNRLFVATGGGFFDDRTLQSGLGFPSLEMVSWGMSALDLEGDGDLDLVVANGHVFDNASRFIRGSSYAMPDHLYLNDGGGRFDTYEFPGAALSSRAVVAGDLDGDGDPDLVVTACGDRLRVWRNDAGEPRRFVVLRLQESAGAGEAYGARVTARLGDRTLLREVSGGGGYASHGDTRVYLGLGVAERIDHLEVRWPDGSTAEASDLAGGQVLEWRRGSEPTGSGGGDPK